MESENMWLERVCSTIGCEGNVIKNKIGKNHSKCLICAIHGSKRGYKAKDEYEIKTNFADESNCDSENFIRIKIWKNDNVYQWVINSS